MIQWKRNYCTCSIETRDRESQCWDAAVASGDQWRDAGVLGWIETSLLISFLSLIVPSSRSMLDPWWERHGGKESREAPFCRLGECWLSLSLNEGIERNDPDHAGELCCFSLPLDWSLPGRCAYHTDATACPCWPTKLLEQMMGSQLAGHDWGVSGIP